MITPRICHREFGRNFMRFLSNSSSSPKSRVDELRLRLANDENSGNIVGLQKNRGSKKTLPKPAWLKAVKLITRLT